MTDTGRGTARHCATPHSASVLARVPQFLFLSLFAASFSMWSSVCLALTLSFLGADPVAVPFTTHSGHFERNDSGLKGEETRVSSLFFGGFLIPGSKAEPWNQVSKTPQKRERKPASPLPCRHYFSSFADSTP